MNKRRQGGFTLIELLAVIAIVLVLLSLLMPTLGNIRGMAMIVRCKAVVKNFGTAACVYAGDSEGRIPSSIYAGCCNGPAGTPWTNAWLGSEVTQGSPGLGSIGFFQRPGILQEYMKAPTSAGYSYYSAPCSPSPRSAAARAATAALTTRSSPTPAAHCSPCCRAARG